MTIDYNILLKTLMWIDEDKCLLCKDVFTMIGSKIVLINILYLNHNLDRSNAYHNAKKVLLHQIW